MAQKAGGKLGEGEWDFQTNDVIWSTTPYDPSALAELPYVDMIGYQQTHSAALENIKAWIARAELGMGADAENNPYKDLYTGDYKMSMRLPYFNEYHHNISQNWEENQGVLGPVVEAATKLATNVAKLITPAAGILYPKNYAGVQDSSYSFTFYLINTYGGADPALEIKKNVEKNKEFIENLIAASLHAQVNSIVVMPPYIWEVYIPGVRWSPAAVINNLVVNNKGTMNSGRIVDGMAKNYIFPDAWEVTIGISELINESRSIYEDAITNGAAAGDQTATSTIDRSSAVTVKQQVKEIITGKPLQTEGK
jgi:hypothetical protein